MSKDATSLRSAHILVVDDEPDLRTLYELTLLREGHHVQTAGSLAEAREQLAQHRFELLIADMRLPDGLGLSLLQDIASQGRTEKAVMITAYGSAENAVEALKQGAFDYLTKPVDLKQFRTVVATALHGPVRAQRPPASAPAATAIGALQRLKGRSQAMQQLRSRIARVAGSMAPVMILGESGTGKELVARAIHDASHRAGGPFVAVNCGAIPENLIEAEFFGARKGAYTGATSDREGYFAAARGGTLLLDEIGDLPMAMQAKLLRVIQERVVRPLGGVQEEQVDVRVLSATHKDLALAVERQLFRQDLFYRLNVIEMRLPALRERREDLDELVQGLMQRICHDSGQPPVPLTEQAREWLEHHPFPGNVRELENLLHRALALCNGTEIGLADLLDTPARAAIPVHAPAAEPRTSTCAPLPTDLQQHLDEQEKAILVRALTETRGNRTAAAALLGLNLRQIRYRIARLDIRLATGPDDEPPQSPQT